MCTSSLCVKSIISVFIIFVCQVHHHSILSEFTFSEFES